MKNFAKKLSIILFSLSIVIIGGVVAYLSAQDTSSAAFFRLRVNNGIDSQNNPINGKNPGIFQIPPIAGCTTAASVGATCTNTFTVNEPDTNYTGYCTCYGSTGVPVVGSVVVVSATSFTCATDALTAAAATCTTVGALLIHN